MNPDAPHYVYRLFDADDRLLYVGATHDVETRLWHLLHPCNVGKVPGLTTDVVSRHTATVYANRRAAFDAEREAIRTERPALNRQSLPSQRKAS
jgi:predicted GIY-YIG superfamily endonuclease